MTSTVFAPEQATYACVAPRAVPIGPVPTGMVAVTAAATAGSHGPAVAADAALTLRIVGAVHARRPVAAPTPSARRRLNPEVSPWTSAALSRRDTGGEQER